MRGSRRRRARSSVRHPMGGYRNTLWLNDFGVPWPDFSPLELVEIRQCKIAEP
ncbi:MAG: hypothetical protein ABI647_03905 [Gemmatimonadota bacterium]